MASARCLCKFLCMCAYISEGFVTACVFGAVADRSCTSDSMQALPMRPCMLTAAGQEKEQLLMGFQNKELTQRFPFISPSLFRYMFTPSPSLPLMNSVSYISNTVLCLVSLSLFTI